MRLCMRLLVRQLVVQKAANRRTPGPPDLLAELSGWMGLRAEEGRHPHAPAMRRKEANGTGEGGENGTGEGGWMSSAIIIC